MMPLEVIEEAQAELPDWKGGMSVMEVSHRGADFIACAAETERSLRELMQIPGNYKVLFLQGGGMGQFAAVPLNLASAGDSADYVLTGQWGAKALKEAGRMGLMTTVVADEKNSKYTRVPAEGSFTTSPNAKYLHYTPNETIGGVEFGYIPQTGDVPLVADLSSTILSRPIDVAKFGVIYAGTQKNMGPAGMAVVIVRDDLLDRARPSTPSIWQYREMADADSMLNTPPTFSIYLLGKILAWVAKNGGLAGMAERNQAKADLLYGFIDDSPLFQPGRAVLAQLMNVPFLMTKPELKPIQAGGGPAGLTNPGHRSVGGMRASIYNAMPIEGVATLVEFMKEFERVHA